MKTKKIYTNTQCSRDFYLSFMHTATHSSVDCNACGRTHFVVDGSLNEDEDEIAQYQELLANAEKDPDGFVAESDNDSITYATIFGKQTVFYCPCNYAGLIEKLILEHESQIIEFLKKKIKNNQDHADIRTKSIKELGQ